MIRGRGIKLTEAEFGSMVEESGISLSELNDQERENLLKTWAADELLYREALQKGIPEEKKRREEIRKRVEDFRKRLIVAEAINELITKKVDVTDDEIRRYYENMKEELFTAEVPMVWLNVFHFRDKEEASEKYSGLKDGEGLNGAIDLGYIKNSDLDENVRDEIISTREGRGVKPVKYIDGSGDVFYYVFIVRDKIWKHDIMRLEGVDEIIRIRIKNIKAREQRKELIDELMVEYNVEISDRGGL